MTQPQAGIFQEGSRHFYFLEYQLNLALPTTQISQALAKLINQPHPGVHLVVAFGPTAWKTLQPNWQPEELVEFTTLSGPEGHEAPSTQGDLLIWLHGEHQDAVFDQVLAAQQYLGELGINQLDLAGFTYHDSRDLIGFVDGTANPKADQRHQAAIIPEGKPGAGGAYVLSQKWVHNLTDFNALPINMQEKVVGRTKKDDIELTGDAMPEDSHVSRTDAKVGDRPLKIYRRSAPYGNAHQQGLYFLAFACEMDRFHVQLERMYGLSEDGIYDKLMDFSKAVTGSYWFAPATEDLQQLL